MVVIARAKHPAPFRTRPLSAAAPMVLRLKTWESRSPPNLERPTKRISLNDPNYRNKQNIAVTKRISAIGAGWSSPVARQAHNLKVVGSNPTPATKKSRNISYLHSAPRGAFCIRASTSTPHQNHIRKTAPARTSGHQQATDQEFPNSSTHGSAFGVTLRREPSDGALEAMISPTLWSTLRSHPRSRSCPPRTRRGGGTGATRTRSGWSRKAIGGIARSQQRRGGMVSRVHC